MQCARHPDITAKGTCARCGDFVCEGCRHPRYPELCRDCGDRQPQGIAWEDPRYGPWPWRFLLTLRDVLVRPWIAFPGPARIAPPLTFIVVCACLVVVYLAGSGVVIALAGTHWWHLELDQSFVCGILLWVPLGIGVLLAFSAVLAGSFASGLISVGRRRGLGRYGFRAAGYAMGLWTIFVLVGGAVGLATTTIDALAADIGNVTWIAVCVVWPPLTGRVFFHAGRGLGLRSGRAIAAASGPTILCTLLAAYMTHVQLGLLPH